MSSEEITEDTKPRVITGELLLIHVRLLLCTVRVERTAVCLSPIPANIITGAVKWFNVMAGYGFIKRYDSSLVTNIPLLCLGLGWVGESALVGSVVYCLHGLLYSLFPPVHKQFRFEGSTKIYSFWALS